MLCYNDKNEEVKKLQLRLLELKFSLPKFGADSHLGKETWIALQQAADKFRVDPLPEPSIGVAVDPDLLNVLFAELHETQNAEPSLLVPSGSIQKFDFRNQFTPSRRQMRMDSKFRPIQRDVSKITGICLHQTAVRYSVSNSQLKNANNNRALALANRGLNTAIHGFVFLPDPNGTHGPLLTLCAPLRYHIFHGDYLNATTLGIEIDGLYAGVANDPKTTWKDQTPVPWTSEMADAAFAMVKWLIEEGKREGIEIKYIYAHRQSSKDRRSDPGEEIWKTVGLRAVKELGLKTEPNRIWGEGRPIPQEWGGDTGVKY